VQRHGRQPDARAQFVDVDPAQPLAEHVHRAAGRVQPGGGQVEQGGLAGPVRPEYHPALVQLDPPRDIAQQVGLAAHHRRVVDPDHEVGIIDGDLRGMTWLRHAHHPITPSRSR
jgi:hypothetical protein